MRRFNDQTDAFVLKLSDDNEFSLIINEGGIGDRPDILVHETALIGTYQLDGDRLSLTGVQGGDRIEMSYVRRGPEPKSWFW